MSQNRRSPVDNGRLLSRNARLHLSQLWQRRHEEIEALLRKECHLAGDMPPRSGVSEDATWAPQSKSFEEHRCQSQEQQRPPHPGGFAQTGNCQQPQERQQSPQTCRFAQKEQYRKSEEKERRRNILLFRAEMMQEECSAKAARRRRACGGSPAKPKGTPVSQESPDLQFTAFIPTDVGLTQDQAIRRSQAVALKQLQTVLDLPTKEQRQRSFKELLRAWHPDKNPQSVEVATIVFQRLQASKVKNL